MKRILAVMAAVCLMASAAFAQTVTYGISTIGTVSSVLTNWNNCAEITTGSNAAEYTLQSISTYLKLGAPTSMGVAVYNTADVLQEQSAAFAAAAGTQWFTVPITGTLSPATSYYICWASSTAPTGYYESDTSGVAQDLVNGFIYTSKGFPATIPIKVGPHFGVSLYATAALIAAPVVFVDTPGPQGPAGPQGIPGVAGPTGPPGSAAICPTSTVQNFPMRFFAILPGQIVDSVAAASTPFAGTISIPPNTFMQLGQMFHVQAEINLSTGITGTPQILFELNGTAITLANGDYIAAATAAPWTYREDYWIVATAIGPQGSVVAFGQQTDQTQNVAANQTNASIAMTPMTAAIPYDTTSAQTIGFSTGADSFTGTVTQSYLGSQLWP
jgi:hypothetical protein